MADQLSPGVVIREIDLTNVVPVVGVAGGATVGDFQWGPVEELTRVPDTKGIENIFGKPNDKNYQYWFSAANFLAYTGDLTIVRVVDVDAKNSTDDGAGLLVKNDSHFESVLSTSSPGVKYVANYPGEMGDSLAISMADYSSFGSWEYRDHFDTAPGTSEHAESLGAKNDELHAVVIDKNGRFTGVVGAILEVYPYLSKAKDGKDSNYAPAYYKSVINQKSQYIRVVNGDDGEEVSTSTGGAITNVDVSAGGTGYTSPTVTVTGGSGSGAVLQAVVGSSGEIERIDIVDAGTGYTNPQIQIQDSAGSGATATATASQVVQSTSVKFGSPLVSDLGVAAVYHNLPNPVKYGLTGGKDSTQVDAQELITGYAMLNNAEEVDVGLIFVAHAGGDASHKRVVQYVIDNVCHKRRDCIVFYSPKLSDVVGKTQSQASQAIVDTANGIARSTSFAVRDSGWKIQYDVYNDKNRMVPLNADLAGLCALASNDYDDWWSPAGYTRGKIRNCISLVYNPDKQSRDLLYKNGINSVVTFKVDGTILYGDKTTQGKNSAFQQIGIRRLFIRLQKAIGHAAKYSLFEFNDEFTRAAFVNMVEPYMREVKGRRGLHDYKVVCDESNNTPEVIMRGEFVGAIYVKPQYSIQWVRLDFVAVRRDVEFTEVVGSI